MNLDDVFEAFGKAISTHMRKGRKIITRIPMRPEWQTLYDAMVTAQKEATAAERKAQSCHRQLWGAVEHDTGEYRSMTWNEEDKVIEVYERTDGPEALPFE